MTAFVFLMVVVAVGALMLLWLQTSVLGRGFSVPLREMRRPKETAEYPEEPRPTQPRFHGRHQLNRYDDGLEKCIGCELCAWACPADAIFVQGADNTEFERFSPGERYASDYQISYARCILCGLCIEACPTRALTMTDDYELAEANRDDLIWGKDRLLADVPSGAQEPPFTTAQVSARGLNYYGGQAVTPPTATRTGEAATPQRSARAGEVVGGLVQRDLPLVTDGSGGIDGDPDAEGAL